VSGALLRVLAMALLRPGAACRAVAEQPRPFGLAVLLAILVTAVSSATLPRQLTLLDQALAPGGDMLRDLHRAAMHAGLLRVIVVDRLVPPPTLVLAAVLLVIASEPVLAVAEDRRRALWAIAIAGLVPLLVQRGGELAVSYLVDTPSRPVPGFPIALPQRFATGALLFWWRDDAPPDWLLSVNARLNLFAGWCVVIWSAGLRQLDRDGPTAWHVALPLGCVALAGLTTFWLRSLAAALVLGTP